MQIGSGIIVVLLVFLANHSIDEIKMQLLELISSGLFFLAFK